MKPARLSLSFPATRPTGDLEAAIEVFHRFIQRGLVEGLILDVADYRHVPDGPGVLLVGHDVDYGVNPRAFTVVRKRSAEDSAATQLRDALRMALGALETIADDGVLDLDVDVTRMTVGVSDRRLGARDEVAAALKAAIEPTVTELYGPDATITADDDGDPRHPAEVHLVADPAAATTVLSKLGGARPPGQSPWDITVEELARLRDSEAEFFLLDVREDSEYSKVNLGGQHIPLSELPEHYDELDRDAHIIVHCRAGGRGSRAAQQLRGAGFGDVWNLNGGLMAWIDRIDPSLPRY